MPFRAPELYHPPKDQYEDIIIEHNEALDLTLIIVIHSTKLGPSLGGMRFRLYAAQDDAIKDALRLAYGMTLKCAVTELPLGGGKCVIMGDPQKQKSPDFYRWIAKALNRINLPKRRYISGEDSGINEHDVGEIGRLTEHITGKPFRVGGSDNPGPMTALGLYYAIEGTLDFAAKEDLTTKRRIADLSVVIQGVGGVGFPLAQYLASQGAEIFYTDVSESSLAQMQAELPNARLIVDPEAAYGWPCDIFIPCAFGGVLNDRTVQELRCWAVVGSANNQLSRPENGRQLKDRNILYAPDFVVNAGGLINVYGEIEGAGGYDITRANARLLKIKPRIRKIFSLAKANDALTRDIAERLALERIDAKRFENPSHL